MSLRAHVALSSSLLALSLAACGGGGEKVDALAIEQGTASLETMAGTEWVYLEEILERGGGASTKTPTAEARLKLFTEDGALRALYNVKSMGDMYEFDCETNEKDILCTQRLDEDFVYNIYASFVTQDQECDAATIKALSPQTPDEVIAAGIEQAQKDIAELQKNEAQFAKFKREHNYLGNKLQFFFKIRVNDSGRVKVSDMYRTYITDKNGSRWQEDYNPVGRNEFVEAPEGLFWGDCEDYSLYSRQEAGFPEDLRNDPGNCYAGAGCSFGVGDSAHFGYYTQNGEGIEAKEGCSYSMDVAYDGAVLAENVAAQTVEQSGKSLVSWTYTHALAEEALHPFAMVMKTSCPGEEAQEFISCTAVNVQ